MILSRAGGLEEAQKGIWNICFSKLSKSPYQSLPVLIDPVLDPGREKFEINTTISGNSMLLEQRLRWRKQALGVIRPDEPAFLSPNSCLCAPLVHLVTLHLSLQCILRTVTRVMPLTHKSHCQLFQIVFDPKKSLNLTRHSKLQGPKALLAILIAHHACASCLSLRGLTGELPA